MKRTTLIYLTIALIIGSCTQEKKYPIEGTWNLVYSSRHDNMTQIKTWSHEYYTFVGCTDTMGATNNFSLDNFGAGTYKLDGNRCEQTTIFHNNKSRIGTKRRVLIELVNDTIIQKDPVDEKWELPQIYNIEKYVRLK